MTKTFPKVFSLALILTLLASALPMQVAHAAPTELFFTEYIEGTSNNKALEIYNGTGAAVNLATGGYNVQMFFNGSGSAGLTINLTGTVATGDVYVLAHSSANTTILAQADQTNGAGWFNGNDAVVLRKGTTVIDVIGQIANNPGTEWGTGLTSTADNTLRRKAGIEAGDTNGGDAFNPATEWDGFATDTFGGLGCLGADCAPNVASTVPANGATGVSRNADLIINFSEPVNVFGTWFTISCGTSGAHTATVTGGPTIFTLNPDTDFAANELCTVNIIASQVTDVDTNDPPDQMPADFTFSVTSADVQFCGDPATFIHTIQGSGLSSPISGNNISIEGIVTADYQGTGQFGGYYVQEEDSDADADPLTSEGIFVFNTTFPVNVGDEVRVRGTVAEFSDLTEITSVSNFLQCSIGNILPSASTVNLPVTNLTDWEAFEGMLVNLPQTLTVTETFTLARFGEVSLSVNGRLFNPTNIVAPGPDAIAQQDLNNRSRIVLDDANNQQNIDPTLYPAGGLSASNTLRSGYAVNGLTGVLEQRFSVYRVQPVGAITFNPTNSRLAAPDPIIGRVRVAAMNVLNYFNGDGLGGGFPTARGATTPAEFTRQRNKIISAITGLNADIVGLMEIENDATPNSAIEDLVAGLNAVSGAGTYAFIDTGIVGTDQIRVALIYKPAKVTPVGAHALLTTAVDPNFIDTLNRPVLAQTFEENQTGERFTVAVNHLKSKGSACNTVGDPDTGDGQGNCNITRTKAAIAEASWLAGDPTGSGDPDFVLIGDFNAYLKEDPITALQTAGYTDLIDSFLGDDAYSFVFQGQSGYLDHALANSSLTSQVTGVTEWHVNADEPVALDYNTEFKSANHVNTLYAPDAYRSSDHDPLIVGLFQYNFTGFFQPVDNLPTFNTVKAGSSVPVKFSLNGDYGLNIFAADFPQSQPIACESGAPVDMVEETVTAGGSSLSYDPLTDQYTYVWKTNKSWTGTCRQLIVQLNDGTTHYSNFQFK